ncbi:hypothetical protein ND748_07790 [Frankia sp. AiPs1]|uniref:hypothetical protein n=1 Tax=Frankia sp. AiPs1 TaxID=573493 RepID=UPI002042EBA4|nr:hypothetical protein [Frankia sp. AiPs1]MCM3921566.1 hypothetical protein [Frankia sp. AiPs1]
MSYTVLVETPGQARRQEDHDSEADAVRAWCSLLAQSIIDRDPTGHITVGGGITATDADGEYVMLAAGVLVNPPRDRDIRITIDSDDSPGQP